VLPELVDQLSYRAFGQAEPRGNVLHRSPIDEHGAEDFVAAMIRISRLSEELAASGVIHDPDSTKMSVGFAGQTDLNRSLTWAAPSMGISVKRRENPFRRPSPGPPLLPQALDQHR